MFRFYSIIIPCYNEAECIERAVQEASFYGQVIVVDNGSTDASFDLAQRAGAHVIKENRRGYGNAIMSGMLTAKQMDLEIALVLDADLSDNPSDIPILVEPILNEGIALCLSSRTRLEDQQNLEPHQRLGNRLAVRLIHWKTGFKYRDMGPFRAFRINTLLNLHLEDENFGWNIEMQMKAALHGLQIREIELPYRKRIAGTSKVSGNIRNSIRAGIIILQSVWKYS